MQDDKLTYDFISPLIVDYQVEGSQVMCQFQAPGSSQIVNSSMNIRRGKNMKSEMTRVMKRNMMQQLRRQARLVMRSVFGGGMASRASSQMINSASRETMRSQQHSKGDIKNAVIEAFKKVQDRFHYDTEKRKWTMGESLSAFEKQLKQAPVKSSYDQEILARMLAELANADGNIASEETEFLESFMPASFNSIDDLLAMDTISEVEFDETDAAARETMFMLAWVMTIVDHDIDPAEKDMLEKFGNSFGLNKASQDKMKKIAQEYIVDSSLDVGIEKDEIISIAENIGMNLRDAERSIIRYRKRKG